MTTATRPNWLKYLAAKRRRLAREAARPKPPRTGGQPTSAQPALFPVDEPEVYLL